MLKTKKRRLPKFLIIGSIGVFIFLIGATYFGTTYYKKSLSSGADAQARAEALKAQEDQIKLLEEKLNALVAQEPTKQSTDSKEQSKTSTETSAEAKKLLDELNSLKAQKTKIEAEIKADAAKPKNLAGFSVENLISKIKPSVAFISFGDEGLGSGFVVDSEGIILTNAHVVKGYESIDVKLGDGETYTGYIANRDEKKDIALIKIEKSGLKPIVFGSSDSTSLPQGSKVYAFGYPFGKGEMSFKDGLISRRFTDNGITYLETTNAINYGNSGGPLVNESGQLVGVNAALFGITVENVAVGESIKLAIPSDDVAKTLEVLKKGMKTLSAAKLKELYAYDKFLRQYTAMYADVTKVQELYSKAYDNVTDEYNTDSKYFPKTKDTVKQMHDVISDGYARRSSIETLYPKNLSFAPTIEEAISGHYLFFNDANDSVKIFDRLISKLLDNPNDLGMVHDIYDGIDEGIDLMRIRDKEILQKEGVFREAAAAYFR